MKVYLDNNASTFVDPLVTAVVAHTLRSFSGNPSSIHSFGREARALLIQSREVIANYLNVHPKEIIFTSGGTEGANMAIKGIMANCKQGHMITSNLEHSCVFSTINLLIEEGHQATFISPGLRGAVSVEEIEKAIQPNTKMIALMAVNNETGVKTDIKAIAALAQREKIPFFVDGVAQLGKESFEIPAGVSAMSFSGHKFHAPKGCGFIYLKSNLKLQPLLVGGEQEYNRRGGTENLADIAGMAEAIRILEKTLPEATTRMLQLRNYFEDSLKKNLGDKISINGTGERICNTVNIACKGVEGETLLVALDLAGIAVSHGSACASGGLEPSRILLNMGLSLETARASLRFSLSRFTTKEEIDYTVDTLVKLINKYVA